MGKRRELNLVKVIDTDRPDLKKLMYENGHYLGDAVQDVDGSWLYFIENTRGGGWSSYLLRCISERLRELSNG